MPAERVFNQSFEFPGFSCIGINGVQLSDLVQSLVMQSLPKQIRLPHPNSGELVQREAICIDHSTGQIIVTSEQVPAPIYTLDPIDN